jgi:branched-chain amino acid transport system permease protein
MSSIAAASGQQARRFPLGTAIYAAAIALAAYLVAVLPLDGYIRNILMQAVSFAIAVCGLTVVLGLCGQISLAQAAFFGIGGYAVALGTTALGLNFWLCLLGGLGLAAVVGALLGLSTLRLGGHYLAMVTISFQQIVTLVMNNWISLTNGPDGVPVAPPALLRSGNLYLAFATAALGAIVYLLWQLPDTRLGRAMRAVRDNELAAGVAGINVYRTKVAAFALCGVLGAAGGGIYAGGFAYISPDQFAFDDSIVFLTMALLGGVISPAGALIGSGLLVLIPETLRFLKSIPGLYLAIYGLAIILIIRFMPDGIWGFVQGRIRALRGAPAIRASEADLSLMPQQTGTGPALAIAGLAKHFGGLKAVDDLSFTVARGRVHALIGPNGSGKTTTLNMLSGIYAPTAGTITLDGNDITALPAHERTSAGLGRTFQNIRLFRSMTALENVEIGAGRPGNDVAGNRAGMAKRAMAALDFVGLAPRAGELVTAFSYGHQRLIEIARALAGSPALLLLDEPAAGLNSTEKLALVELLKRIAATGLTVLIIDHDMTLVTAIADHITVLNFGRRIADGGPAEVLNHQDVITAYLGTALDAPA